MFEKSDTEITDWSAKQPADLKYSPVELDQTVLRGMENGEFEHVSIQGPENQFYTAHIHRILHYKNGDWSAIGFVDDERINSFALSYSRSTKKVLVSVRVASDHSFFELRYDSYQNRHILVEKDPHESDELACGHDDQLTIRDEDSRQNKNTPEPTPSPDHGPSTIDVLIVYTPQAENWANTNSSGIDNIINQSMAVAQLTAENSLLDIEFNLVHSQLIQYTESGNSETDLRRLTASPVFNPWGSESAGYMDEVHQIRDAYSADVVALFTFTKDVGGIAWVISNVNGLPHYAFSISRVQQAAGSTHAHEMGHNFGNAHSRNQNSAPAGSNGGLFTYSTGWRWIGSDGHEYTSVMTYPEGANGVLFFSNPDVSFLGVPTGSYEGEFAPADNARSMQEIQQVVAEYRTPNTDIDLPTVITASVSDISYSIARVGGNVSANGGAEISERGVCLSTTVNPGFSDVCRGIGAGTGTFETLLTNLEQGTEYYLRAFATNQAGTSFGNQQLFTTQTLPKPVVLSASNINAVAFAAQWSDVPEAERYFLDVSATSDFSAFVSGFQNMNVGDGTSFLVTDLMPGTDYYYRVRSGAETAQSEHSNVSNVSTVDISTENSSVNVSRDRVLATGVQESIIKVTVQNSNGNPVENAEIVIEPGGGSSNVSPGQAATDNNGTAMFSVTNTSEETIRYSVLAAGLNLSSEVEIEFLFSDGELTLGNNYPNPYNNQTMIPIVIPGQTRVKMDVVNTMGSVVQTVVDEQFNTGYYEIPFNGSGLASGVYFYRMITEQGIRVEKMLLMK